MHRSRNSSVKGNNKAVIYCQISFNATIRNSTVLGSVLVRESWGASDDNHYERGALRVEDSRHTTHNLPDCAWAYSASSSTASGSPTGRARNDPHLSVLIDQNERARDVPGGRRTNRD